MASAKIDELNILGGNTENSSDSFDYHDFILHYFDPMQISERQKKKRIEAAEEIFDAILLFFMWCENAPERVEEENTVRSFENMYKEVIFQYSEPDDYLDKYVTFFMNYLIRVTLEHPGEEYFTSVERAANVAANESNQVIGHKEFEDAKLLGYTKKIWRTELDERVRLSHQEVEGMTIPIDDLFVVGDSLLLFPKDISHGADPREIVNCRCSLEFKKEV